MQGIQVSNISNSVNDIESVIKTTMALDGYSATINIRAVSPQSKISVDQIVSHLAEKKIVYGLQPERLLEVVGSIKTGPVGKIIVVAKGAALEQGVDGKSDFQFQTKLAAGKVDERRINFKERGFINNVEAGQIIARMTPHIPGKPGMRVDGEVVNPRSLQVVKIPTAGMNVEMATEGNTFVFRAKISGIVRVIFNELQVTSALAIAGDIDYSTGNIDSLGDIEINGSVKSGFQIKSGGNILIHGNIEPDSVVISGKELTVEGIINCNKNSGKVIVGGSLNAKRILNSFIECKGNIYVKDELIDSVVFCSGKLVTSFAKIISCKIEAIAGVVANSIGKAEGVTECFIDVGFSLYAANKLKTIGMEREKAQYDMSLLSRQVSIGSGEEEAVEDEGNEEKIKRLAMARSKLAKELKERLEQLNSDLAHYSSRLKEDPAATIVIKKAIYPSCIIHLGQKELKVLEKPLGPCTLDCY